MNQLNTKNDYRNQEFTDAAAEILAGYEAFLELSGIGKLSDAAEAMSKHEGELYLNSLTSLSDAAVESLSKHKGELSLSGLKSLTMLRPIRCPSTTVQLTGRSAHSAGSSPQIVPSCLDNSSVASSDKQVTFLSHRMPSCAASLAASDAFSIDCRPLR